MSGIGYNLRGKMLPLVPAQTRNAQAAQTANAALQLARIQRMLAAVAK